MKKAIVLLLSVFGLSMFAHGQQATSSNEAIQQQITMQNQNAESRQARQNGADEMLGESSPASRRSGKTPYEKVKNIYRKPNNEERKILSPNKEDLDKYSQFLKKRNNGLIKLIPDVGCTDNPAIVVASKECLKYTMPGAGASFSFRKRSHSISSVADLKLKDENLITNVGTMIQGFMVNIGDVQLEEINDNTKGMNFITNFKPAKDSAKVAEMSKKFADGIDEQGLLYKSILPVEEGSTYLLRSVAYRGEILRAVDGAAYDETDWDKRGDVLVAFRVIRQHSDGSITILWKRISKKGSPKLKDDSGK